MVWEGKLERTLRICRLTRKLYSTEIDSEKKYKNSKIFHEDESKTQPMADGGEKT